MTPEEIEEIVRTAKPYVKLEDLLGLVGCCLMPDVTVHLTSKSGP